MFCRPLPGDPDGGGRPARGEDEGGFRGEVPPHTPGLAESAADRLWLILALPGNVFWPKN